MRNDVVEVTIAIGDTIVTTGHAAGPIAFDWAPDHLLVPPAERDVPVRTRIGIAEVTLTRVAAPERTLPYPSDLDRRAWRYLALSLAVHLLMWGVATTQAPVSERSVGVCPARYPDQTVWVTAPPSLPEETEETEDGDDGDVGAHGRIVSMALETRGTLAESAASPTRETALEQARTAGILGSGALANLGSGVDVMTALDTYEVYGPLYGPGAEAASGFGVERSSSTTAGGCTDEPCGTIGTIGYLPIKPGIRTGEGYPGGARSGLRSRSSGFVCTLPMSESVSSGDLSKEVIRRHLRRQIDKLTYCYEKQLLAKPDLAGEVKLDFLIDPNGHVQALVAEGVSGEVSTCVGDVVKAIEFPKASNGGSTRVKYPVQFRISGS